MCFYFLSSVERRRGDAKRNDVDGNIVYFSMRPTMAIAEYVPPSSVVYYSLQIATNSIRTDKHIVSFESHSSFGRLVLMGRAMSTTITFRMNCL